MGCKKIVAKKSSLNTRDIKDTVIFMTAYKINESKHQFARFWQKNKIKSLLNQFHISGISYKNAYISPDIKFKYSVNFDSLKRISAFDFEEVSEINKENSKFINEIIPLLTLQHSNSALLDSSQVKIPICFNMEQFLVVIDKKVYQVDSFAYFMNDTLIVCFELIDYESKRPLECDSIFGREDNFGIKQIEQIRYFDESDYSTDERKISDIISKNLFDFLSQLTKGRFVVEEFSFVHNILVLSNRINNVDDYFQKVLGANIKNFKIDNISATNAFEYYLIESLGVVTDIRTTDNKGNIMFDCIMLESFKMYLLLKMVIDYEINHKLEKIIDSQIYVESLFYPAHVPIITLNMIEKLKETATFSRYKEAIAFKVQSLKIWQDRKSAKNGRLMNILLYVLAIFGSAQTLDVLDKHFGLPFKYSFWVVTVVFVLFGIVWANKEFKKE